MALSLSIYMYKDNTNLIIITTFIHFENYKSEDNRNNINKYNHVYHF